MQLEIIGLGRMGGNIARRLLVNGQRCVVHDLNITAVDALTAHGATGAENLIDLVRQLAPPRLFWVMLPADAPTAEAISFGEKLLSAMRFGFGGHVEPGPRA